MKISLLFQLAIKKIHYRLIKFSQRWTWFFIRPMLKKWEKNSEWILPEPERVRDILVILSPKELLRYIPRSKNQTRSLISWLETYNPKSRIELVYGLRAKEIQPNSLIVISHEYNMNVLMELSFWRVYRLAFNLRKRRAKVWIFPPDGASLDYMIRNSILVSKCGGGFFCQTNTTEQMRQFGVPHSMGPVIWTVEREINDREFHVENFSEKKKMGLLAGSGGGKSRKLLTQNIKPQLEKLGYKCCYTTQSLPWHEYVELVKASSIVVTTSDLQDTHTRRMWMFGNSLPKTTLTDRILEGFQSRSLIITTHDCSLIELGFVPGVHFLEITNISNPISEIENLDTEIVEQIALAGHRRMNDVIQMQSSLLYLVRC